MDYKWRIQDFPFGGVPSYYFGQFHETEKIWTERGCSLGSVNDYALYMYTGSKTLLVISGTRCNQTFLTWMSMRSVLL